MRSGYGLGFVSGWLVALFLAMGCGAAGVSGPRTGTTLALPIAPQGLILMDPVLEWPLVQASDAALDRWQTCDLSGWTVEITKGYVPHRGDEQCGTEACPETARLLGVTRPGTIQFSDQIPPARILPVVRWELCNACRRVVTGQWRDVGCQ